MGEKTWFLVQKFSWKNLFWKRICWSSFFFMWFQKKKPLFDKKTRNATKNFFFPSKLINQNQDSKFSIYLSYNITILIESSQNSIKKWNYLKISFFCTIKALHTFSQNQSKHFLCIIEEPDSSYSCLEIQSCWKVEREARMEPPI